MGRLLQGSTYRLSCPCGRLLEVPCAGSARSSATGASLAWPGRRARASAERTSRMTGEGGLRLLARSIGPEVDITARLSEVVRLAAVACGRIADEIALARIPLHLRLAISPAPDLHRGALVDSTETPREGGRLVGVLDARERCAARVLSGYVTVSRGLGDIVPDPLPGFPSRSGRHVASRMLLIWVRTRSRRSSEL